MKTLQTIPIKEYLTRKGTAFREVGQEIVAHCIFSNCDSNSTDAEGHLYFDAETGQYDCKKCGAKGNLVTLAKYLGDDIKDIALNPIESRKSIKHHKLNIELVESCHNALPEHIRKYLNDRGIVDAIIDEYKLGWGEFYHKFWITIPIKDTEGDFTFFKLRQDPNHGKDKMTYPKGIEAQIYDWETLQKETDKIVICEGEMDRLALLSKNITAITSTHGAMTFKQEWCEKVGKGRTIYICYDNDDAGKKGAERVAKMVENGGNKTYIITLPNEVGDGGDITDYLIKLNGNPDDLFTKYAKEYPEKIDISQFKPMSSKELIDVLGLTIKKDNENKIITFLCQLSAYTDSSQFNISFNAPSSTGKSYIPLEISNLFPEEDLIKLGNCSPQAFYHEQGVYNKEKNNILVDLSKKIIIFLDQPHNDLLTRLRAMLSHDEKEIQAKITDKAQKGGNKTKTIIIRGFPAVIFCSAGLKIDEQEGTRFLLLSPETSQEKMREAIFEKIKKETDSNAYKEWLDSNSERVMLKNRIMAIKQEGIKQININSTKKIEERFLNSGKKLKSRHSRDVGRLIAIAKLFALLNLWFRERKGSTITTSDEDIEEAFKIWDTVSESQELNLPPYIFKLYKEVILPLWNERKEALPDGMLKEGGLTRQEVIQKSYKLDGRLIPDWQYRLHILPMLENAGLIREEEDIKDKRKKLIYPTVELNISKSEQNNNELEGGVNIN